MNRTPSSAALWSACAKAGHYPKGQKDASGTDAAEGDAVHWAAARLLTGQTVPPAAPNGVGITEEMMENAASYAQTVLKISGGKPLSVEVRGEAAEIHETCRGDIDSCFVDYDTRTVYVWDYKNGYRPVRAYKNPQLTCYMQMLVEQFDLTGDWTFHATIVQPHDYRKTIKTWTTNSAELAHEVGVLARAAAAGDATNPTATVGFQCRDCGGRAECEALRVSAATAVDWSLTDDTVELTDTELGLELAVLQPALDRLKQRVEGLEVVARERIRRGSNVFGFVMKPVSGKEKWTVPSEQVIAAGALLGLDLAKKVVLTPKQAREAGLDEKITDAWATRPRGFALKPARDFEEKD